MGRDLMRRLDSLETTRREDDFQRDVAEIGRIMDELSAKAAGGDPHERHPDRLADYLEATR